MPADVTGAVSIRPSNIKYSMNEVFMDVVESVNVLISSTGNVMRSEILGYIKLKVHLSGIPELRLGLNDKFVIDSESIFMCLILECSVNCLKPFILSQRFQKQNS